MADTTIGLYIGGFISLYLSCSLASSAGLGGGGLNVPILLVIIGFPYKTCVVLSLCAVLGNHCSQTTINWFKSHPYDDKRPLIYWDAVLIFLPATLGGTTLGVVISPTLPETLLLTFAMCVVIFALYKAISKGVDAYRTETDDMKFSLSHPLLDASLHNKQEFHNSEYTAVHRDDSIQNVTNSKRIIIYRNVNFPRPNFTILIALMIVWIAFAIIYVTLQVATSPCTKPYYILLSLTFIPLTISILWAVNYVSKKQVDGSNPLINGDIDFSKLSFIPPILSFLIGILCSLLGLGTAEMMGPLLLSLKMIPLVSSATTSAMSLLYTSSTLLHYGILGQINYKFALITFIIGLLGGLTGRLFALYIAKRFKRPSFVVLTLSLILFISLILLLYDVFSSTDSADFQFHPIC